MNHIHESNVLDALHQGRKIDAIKMLRASRGIGLKEANDLIQNYLVEHPHLSAQMQSPYNTLIGVAVLLAMVLGVWYFGYVF